MLSAASDIKTFLFFFTKKLRLSNPWNFKVPLLISIPYIVFLLSGHHQCVFPAVLASVLIITGVAGIGYLTNDLGDRHKDGLIGKENATAQLSVPAIVFLFVLFMLLAIAPWFYLPVRRWSVGLLVMQFLLFYVYAFPPFRFKERGFLGVITDAGYAHINPALLAAYTFYLYTGKAFAGFYTFMLLLATWQLVLGIRNILFHQVKDHDKDIESGTHTFVTGTGIAKTTVLLKTILLPLETVLFIAFAGLITFYLPFFLPVIVLYWLFVTKQFVKNIKTKGFRDYAYLYLDDLYIKWVPLIVLTGLVMRSVNFLPVLVLHFLIFRTDIKTFLMNRASRLR